MCGIVGFAGSETKNFLLNGLERLEYRGYDSAGIAVQNKGETEVFRVKGRVSDLRLLLHDNELTGQAGIGHTRWATHGVVNAENAHPHRVGSITLVHNGIIENHRALREELVAAGHIFSSETDSEVVAHLLNSEIENGCNLENAIRKVMPRLEGSYAFAILCDKEPGLLAGVKNGAPLLVGIGEGTHILASDAQAVSSQTDRVIYLEDYTYALCTENRVEVHHHSGKSAVTRVTQIDHDSVIDHKAGYDHFMLKEIFEQPIALSKTVAANRDAIDVKTLSRFHRIHIVACGTSYHAALLGRDYLERFTKASVRVDVASEFRYQNLRLDRRSLVIFLSQSGETADTIAALREAKMKGAMTLAIVNVRGSSLAREAHQTLYTEAGAEIGVASTKAFTTQITLLYLLAARIGKCPEQLDALSDLFLKIEDTLALGWLAKEVAERHAGDRLFLFIGRGLAYPMALEGALKLKELTYVPAQGYPSGELKHGPIALIDERTTTIVLAPAGPLRQKTLGNLQEVKARRGRIIGIGSERDAELENLSESFLPVPHVPIELQPIVLAIPLQLFAYYMALHLGKDIDKPRNLAKSVTVE